MTEALSRRIDAARVPVCKDWTPTPATHCSECGDELEKDAGRVWSRDLCSICRADINRAALFVETEECVE